MQISLFSDAQQVEQIDKGAVVSQCKRYRYALWRIWDKSKPPVGFLCLNPSTADADADDPTLRRLVGFAERWGHGGLYLTNLFALRATDPKQLRRASDPIGPENDQHLRYYHKLAQRWIAAWGCHGPLFDRCHEVMDLLGHPEMYCLGQNQDGTPVHPLYQPYDAILVEYTPPPGRGVGAP